MFRTALFGSFSLLFFSATASSTAAGNFQSNFFRLLSGFEFIKTDSNSASWYGFKSKPLLLDIEFFAGRKSIQVEYATEHGFIVSMSLQGLLAIGFADFCRLTSSKKLFTEDIIHPLFRMYIEIQWLLVWKKRPSENGNFETAFAFYHVNIPCILAFNTGFKIGISHRAASEAFA